MHSILGIRAMNNLGKGLFMFVCLANKSNSSTSLGSTIKQAKLKYNNILVKKLMKHEHANLI